MLFGPMAAVAYVAAVAFDGSKEASGSSGKSVSLPDVTRNWLQVSRESEFKYGFDAADVQLMLCSSLPEAVYKQI